MSRIFVFATKWLEEIFGDNLEECKMDPNPQGWEGPSIYQLKLPDSSVKIYGFLCRQWDNGVADIKEMLTQWNKCFREKENDEIFYILHDKIFRRRQPAFFFTSIDSRTTVYGFQHQDTDNIGNFMMWFDRQMLEESVHNLKIILEILKIRDLLIDGENQFVQQEVNDDITQNLQQFGINTEGNIDDVITRIDSYLVSIKRYE